MPRITFTFDNGPEPDITPHVLDCLGEHGVKATFFVLGSKVSQPASEVISRRANAEGHWIGNHTFTHKTPLGELDEAEALAEFEMTEKAIAWVRQPVRLFRPLGRGLVGPNLLHPAVATRLIAGGYQCVLWNSLPGDWRDRDGWMERALKDCRTRDWTVIAVHDLPNGCLPYLDQFITVLKSEGFQFTQEFSSDCVPTDLSPYCSTGVLENAKSR